MATASDFSIVIHNGTDAEVKVTKFEYKDGSNWKTGNILGVEGHQTIEKDRGVVFKRDLGGIGDESTQFRLTYQHHVGGTLWGTPICTTTSSFVCHDNGRKTVTLTA